MKRAVGALLPLLLWACEPATLPAPSIVSVEPEQLAAGFPSALSVKVSAVLGLSVDYQTETVDPAQLAMTVHLADRVVDIPFADPDGSLIVPVPETLAPGDYSIRVALADGRETVRERAFSIVPTPANTGGNDGGSQEDGGSTGGLLGGNSDGIVGLRFDPLGDQVRGKPFQVTVRAVGPAASTFDAPVTLRASKGAMSTPAAGAFTRGVRVEQISLSHPAPNVYLLAEDAHGHRALSNSFRVAPH
jgi:hypothetical protein